MKTGGSQSRVFEDDYVRLLHCKLWHEVFVQVNKISSAAIMYLTIYPLYQFFQFLDFFLNTGLSENVIYLNTIKKLRHTPIRVCFDVIPLFFREFTHVKIFDFHFYRQSIKTLVSTSNLFTTSTHQSYALRTGWQNFFEEDNKKRRDKVIHSLHIARRGMTNSPNK